MPQSEQCLHILTKGSQKINELYSVISGLYDAATVSSCAASIGANINYYGIIQVLQSAVMGSIIQNQNVLIQDKIVIGVGRGNIAAEQQQFENDLVQ